MSKIMQKYEWSLGGLEDNGRNNPRHNLQPNNNKPNHIHNKLQPVDKTLPDKQIHIAHNNGPT